MPRRPAFFPLTLPLLFSSTVLGFGTINEPNVIGQHCEHERITRAAFACPAAISDGRCFEGKTLDQLAGTSQEEGYVGQGSNGAVGAPDMLDPTPEGPEAHCDNADFLDSESLGLNTSYPRTREQATSQLQVCVSHLRSRFGEGIDAADRIVDENARIVVPMVDISSRDCMFSFPELQLHQFARAKCSAIEGFGRALHGIQDFYAHSNWADDAKPPFRLDNPPGLRRDDNPLFLDLRAENNIAQQVPHNLSTGCFGGIMTDGPVGKAGHPLEPGSLDCTGRVTHHTLNKDNGIIDETTGKTKNPGPNTPRSDFPDNFERAVSAAIKDTRRQWRLFREEIRRMYGTERGNIIICSLARDNPTTDCYGRRVAVLRGFPDYRNRITSMQIPIHTWLLEELDGKAHDEGPGEGLTEHNSTKSKGSSDELLELVADDVNDDAGVNERPVSEGIDLSTALTELVGDSTLLPANKTSIVALTEARDLHIGDTIAHIWRAGDLGIRIHLGILPTEDASSPKLKADSQPPALENREQDLITAVLRTGGTYSTLHNSSCSPKFIEHVISRGLSQYDNAEDTATLLLPGLTISDFVTPEAEPRRYTFEAHSADNIIIAVAPVTSKLSLHIAIRHVRRNMVVTEADIGVKGNATFRTDLSVDDIPRTDAWFELEVAHVPGDDLAGSGLFEVNIETETMDTGVEGNEEQTNNDLKGSRKHDEL
jgi:hypothetical protein